MGEFAPYNPEEESPKTAQAARELAQTLAAMDQVAPTGRHYDEALETLNTLKQSNPDRADRIIDHNVPQQRSSQDLIDA